MKLPFKLPQLPHNTQQRNRVGGLLLGISMAVIFCLLYVAGPLKSFENFDLDFKFKMRQSIRKPPANKDIVFLQIDDPTLFWEKTFPDDPLYYIDFIKQFGQDQTNALAVGLCLDYSRPFGRKVDSGESEVLLDNLGKVTGLMNQYAGMKSNMLMNLDYYKELLSGPDAMKVTKDLSGNITKLVSDPNLGGIMNTMSAQVGPYLSSINYDTLAPYREGLIADAVKNAKNVYFTYESKAYLDTPYTVNDLRNNASIRELFVKIMNSPSANRPENAKEGLIYDTYMDLKPKDFDVLLKPGANAFSGGVIARLRRDKTAKENEEREFLVQNGLEAFKMPPEVANVYEKLRSIKPVVSTLGRYSAGQGFGKAEFSPGDGTLRTIAPVAIYDGKLYPHIDLLLAMKYLRVSPKDVVFEKNRIILKNATHPKTKEKRDIVIPLENGKMLINWVGLWADTTTFPQYNLQNMYAAVNRLRYYKINQQYQVLSEKDKQTFVANMTPAQSTDLQIAESVAKDMKPSEAAGYEKLLDDLRGKIILVGRTAVGTAEINPTPLESRFHMLGLHANAINTIVENLLIRKPGTAIILLIFFALSVSLGLIGGMVHTHSSILTALINFFIMLVVAAAYGAVCIFAFSRADIDMPMLSPIASIILTFLAVFLFRFITEEAEKKKMQGMFSTYVNKEVVDSLIENPDMLKLGGTWMNCTVFFSDVAGFTTISEALKPEELVELLNEYLTAMTDIVFKYGGTLDKYIGDAIVAVYGAPIHFDDHAMRACMATIEMQEKLAEMRIAWKEQGKHELTARCGINTGDMISGNMGSTKRFNYTVIGPNVELGEHLESGGKTYGTIMTISEETKRQAGDSIITRWLDIIEYDGHDKPFRLFELMAKSSVGISDETKKAIEIFEEATMLYFKREWDKSLELFNEVYKYIPGCPTTKKSIERCEAAKKDPPGPEFDELLATVAPLS